MILWNCENLLRQHHLKGLKHGLILIIGNFQTHDTHIHNNEQHLGLPMPLISSAPLLSAYGNICQSDQREMLSLTLKLAPD